jgi:proteic killer suppression protein
MIKGFKSKATEQLFSGDCPKKWLSFREQAEKRLQILDSATCLEDLRFLPSNHLETLKGDRKGQFSIRINQKWRICFKWNEEVAIDVEIVDYH